MSIYKPTKTYDRPPTSPSKQETVFHKGPKHCTRYSFGQSKQNVTFVNAKTLQLQTTDGHQKRVLQSEDETSPCHDSNTTTEKKDRPAAIGLTSQS